MIFRNTLLTLTTTLGLFLAASTVASAGARTIVIDAGHGGHDNGGVPGQRVSEKVLALDTSLRLKKELERRGFNVVMTRSRDVFIPLATRVAIANKYRGAIFVSVHYNSARRSSAQGFETYFYSKTSAPLAYRIQRNILRTASTENRGIKQRGFYVLRNTKIPAVLVECGFLTNRTEAKRCMKPTYRQALAEQIAAAVTEYHSAGSRKNAALLASLAN
jgi:N-acetylmuramoyl-L-alanine amidase